MYNFFVFVSYCDKLLTLIDVIRLPHTEIPITAENCRGGIEKKLWNVIDLEQLLPIHEIH